VHYPYPIKPLFKVNEVDPTIVKFISNNIGDTIIHDAAAI